MTDKNNPFLIQRLKSFKYAFQGLFTMFKEEPNFRIHFIAAFLAVILGFYFGLTPLEWMLVTIVIGFVLISEIFNSAVERIANFVSPGHNKLIGVIKDISAAMVLVAAIVSIVVGLIIFVPKF